jgi:hypothetical protein
MCTVVAIFISYYLNIKRKIEAEVPGAINGAEDTGMSGAEKFEEAVNTIYALIPLAVRPFITRSLVETLVQEVFDKMEEYARKQLNKADNAA